MRKIILSMLVLAGATTYAQVGINEESPKATLDIKAKSLNTEDNLEGLLIPRVSKNKAFKMTEFIDATDPTKVLTESTMIYVNDLTYSGSDDTVAEITENGFYFWNGSKWVRSSGANGEEWVYDPATKQINLKRSGQSTEFTNKVFYDATNGGYFNYEDTEIDELVDVGTNEPDFFKKEGIKHYFQSNSKSITPYHDTKGGKNYNEKSLYENLLYLDETSASPSPLRIKSASLGTITSINNAAPTRDLIGASLYVKKQDTQETNYVVGSANSANISNGRTKVYGFGSRTQIFVNSAAEQNVIASERHQATVGTNAGKIKELTVLRGSLGILGENNSTIDRAFGLNYSVSTQEEVTAKIGNLYGFYYNTNGIRSNTTVNNSYGLFIQDIKGATNDNYAIYTKAGNIRFGDLEGHGDRLVLASNYGVLKTTDTSLSDLESLWANDASAELVKLKNTSKKVARTDDNRVTISDAGAITAKAFIGYHGASIFPDYVFEKYYKGYSNIKADYNFHNLASVESFIKKNGHLPGYKSAKEIAKEGLIDISATQLTNVEKIEELYLHLIEKDKEVQSLKSELKSQKEEISELKALVNQLINK